MYRGNFEAWGKIGRAEGMRGIFTGWAPTFFGYSVSTPALITPERAYGVPGNCPADETFVVTPIGPRCFQIRRI